LQRESGDLLEETMARLDQAASFQPDIACLPELFPNRPPEPVPGPVTERLAAWARQRSCYVVFGLKTKTGNRIFNSAVLIDRKGQVSGVYSKTHPTEGELEEGTTPGRVDPPLFETDFGVIGVQICFDVNWWESWKRLKQLGAKIVFFPSAFPAARQLSALALMNQYYIVSSAMRGSSRSTISLESSLLFRHISSGLVLYSPSASAFSRLTSTSRRRARSSRSMARKSKWSGPTTTIGLLWLLSILT
jgi:predicted amidohydrolase